MFRSAALLLATTLAFSPLAVAPPFALAQTTRPSLQSFDADVRQLYQEVQQHLVRVQVPVRVPYDHPLIKWRLQLDPALRDRLDAARAKGVSPHLYLESPATRPAESTGAALPGSLNQDRIPLPAPSAVIDIECAGMILDAQGDVLLPLFVDKDYLDKPMPVMVDQMQATTASLVAADRQTSLSVVRLAVPAGKPARFAQRQPVEGSLVLLIASTRRAARIGIWTGGQDDNAIVVNADGEFAALVRNGHPMYPATFSPIVDQLLRYGQVRRARLGVAILDVTLDDPLRVKVPTLGARTAVRVEHVQVDSAAANGGIQAGDLILSIAGQSVEDVPTFSAAVATRRGNTELLLLRDGHPRTITVDLEPQ